MRRNVAKLTLTSAGCPKSLESFVPEDTASIINETKNDLKKKNP